jgi:hypothetical protein
VTFGKLFRDALASGPVIDDINEEEEADPDKGKEDTWKYK